MHQAEVAVIGAGVAGSLAATMLGRAGHSVVLLDPVHPFGADFRCEKIDHKHAEPLINAGVLDELTPAGSRYEGIWTARRGRLVESRPIVEYGIDYADLVNRMRDLLPPNVAFLQQQVVGADLAGDCPRLALSNGEQVHARLVVLANGLNPGLLETFGLERTVASKCHSISIGFDVAPVGQDKFPFESLTYYGEDPSDRISYITFFPIADRMRVNLFIYRELNDPWHKALREKPAETLFAALPKLRGLTGNFEVVTPIKFRPVDLVNTQNYLKPGLVVVGDAFSTACPTSGTGASKAFVDVERLCNVYAPRWLAAQGPLGTATIAEFYADPVKRESDRESREISLFAKRLALEPGLTWSLQRWVRFAGGLVRNAIHQVRGLFAPVPAKTWSH